MIKNKKGGKMRKSFFIMVTIFFIKVNFCGAIDLSNVTFYHSFDKGLPADLSRGKSEPVEIGGKPEFVSGKKGNALKLVNGVTYLGYEVKNNMVSSQGTISFWLSPVNWDGSMKDVLQILFHTGKGMQQIVIQELWPRKSIFMATYNENNIIGGFPSVLSPSVPLFSAQDAASVLKPGEWYHIIFTWQNGKITAYLNGAFQGELKTPEIKLTSLGNLFYLGWKKNEGNLFIDPNCDEIARPIAEKPWETIIDEFTIFNCYIFGNQAAKIYEYGAVEYARRAEPNPISIETSFYPSKERLKVIITAPVNEPKEGKVVVKDMKGNLIIEKPFNLTSDQQQLTMNVELKGIKEGIYSVIANLLKEGKIVTESNETTFEKRLFEWIGNNIGKEDIVLPPWTPIKVEKEENKVKISVWGREYTFLQPFPFSIISQEEEILGSPVNLFLKSGDSEIIPVWSDFKISRSSPTKVFMEGKGNLGPYEVKVDSRLEYDGMLWYELQFSSSQEQEIDNLRLDIPIRKDMCVLFHYPCNLNYWFPQKLWSSDFLPYLWVGNDKAGLQWFAESDQYWYAKDPKKKLEIISDKDNGIIRINIVRDKIKMPKEFKIAFGLHATPVKPRPIDWRSWNYAGGNLPWRQGEPQKYRNLRMDYSWWAISPAWLIPRHMEEKSYTLNKPIMSIPFTSTSFLGIRRYDAKEIYDYLPEWRIFSSEWIKIPEVIVYGKAPGWSNAFVNPTPSYCDFYVYQVEQLFKKYDVDGLYFDGYAGEYPSANLEAGFGYIDRNGQLKPTYPILAGRELARRIYSVIRKYRPEKGVIIIHPATTLIMPIMSFSDGNFDGENMMWAQLFKKMQDSGWYSSALTKDWLRANYNMKPFGLIPTFDCRLHTLASIHPDQLGQVARELFGLLVSHDIHSWGGWTLRYEKTISIIFDYWGINDPEVEFFPYWDKEPVVTVTLDQKGGKWDECFASAWINRKAKKMLIVALNLSGYALSPERFKKEGKLGYFLNLNLKKLGLEGKKLKITDAESFGKLEFPYENGKIGIAMSPHDVVFVNIEWE
jgi:hypothetical protein